jgi:hypothetical protein
MYVYINIYIYIYMYIFIYIYIYFYVYIFMYICMYNIHINTYIYIYINIHTSTNLNVTALIGFVGMTIRSSSVVNLDVNCPLLIKPDICIYMNTLDTYYYIYLCIHIKDI